ncbi:MAG: EAL domain-containing protein [Acidimicrobiia bacterium]|nr:EAL domain-containing protein [Acidimicrobiia bacterium]
MASVPAIGGRSALPSEAELARVLDTGDVRSVVQPILALADQRLVAYEALARVGVAATGPLSWLEAADRFRCRVDLELLCLDRAMAIGPPPGEALLFVNLSPSTLGDPRAKAICEPGADRLVLEVSEGEIIADYERFLYELRGWTDMGARVAVDDTGAGYASLRHVLALEPDFIKLDRSLIAGIESDRNRQALVTALASFAMQLGSTVVAEGVETAAELDAVRASGVELAQGFLLGVPDEPWSTAVGGLGGVAQPADVRSLRSSLALAPDPQAACEAVVEELHRRGWLPSVYLLEGDRLRCQAQRGLWQVLDGLTPGVGVTGRCFVEGREFVLLGDPTTEPGYREAVPGVRAEVCVPLRVEGVVVGALNVERAVAADPLEVGWVRRSAALLGERLAVVGREPVHTPLDRLGHHARWLAEAPPSELTARALASCRELSGMSTAALIRCGGGDPSLVASSGPLEVLVASLQVGELRTLVELVEGTAACYTAGSTVDQGLAGTERLRRAGARAVTIVPVRVSDAVEALLLLAHGTPRALRTAEVEPLEVVASLVGARLRTQSTLD